MVVGEHVVGQALGFEVGRKVVGNEIVVGVVDCTKQGLVDTPVVERVRLDSLEDLGELGRALMQVGVLVLVVVANTLNVVREVTEKEALVLAGFLSYVMSA